MEEKGLRGGLGKKRNGVCVQGLGGSEEGEEGSRVKMRRGAAEEEVRREVGDEEEVEPAPVVVEDERMSERREVVGSRELWR